MSIYDQALKGAMQGVILSGMTAASIGPDSNQVQTALANLKWLVVMDALPTTSSEFWHAPGVVPSQVKTEVFMLPTTHWIEKDGSFTNSGRWAQWKDQVLPPQGQARHDHWILSDLFHRVKTLYQQQSGKFPDPIMHLTLDYQDPLKPGLDEIAKAINGKDLSTGKQMTSFANLTDDGTTTRSPRTTNGSSHRSPTRCTRPFRRRPSPSSMTRPRDGPTGSALRPTIRTSPPATGSLSTSTTSPSTFLTWCSSSPTPSSRSRGSSRRPRASRAATRSACRRTAAKSRCSRWSPNASAR